MENRKGNSLKSVQQTFFRVQLILIITLALILGVSGTLINMQFETEKRDQNLRNIAEAIANSPMLITKKQINIQEQENFSEYLDTLKGSLEDIDVISVVNKNGVRVYHSNHELIGTRFDGNFRISRIRQMTIMQ